MMIGCVYHQCSASASITCVRISVKTGESWPRATCNGHHGVAWSSDCGLNHYQRNWTFLYLPIVQPVVGSEQAIAMEVALHAACRLLRICKGDSVKRDERDEAEQTLALLRQAQAEAWDRVHGRAA